MGINAGMALTTAQGAGAAVSALGAYYGASAQKLQLQGAAQIADINAQQSELSAQQELARGQSQAGVASARAGQVKGAQRAAMAANGIDLGVGSAAEVLTSTDIAKENDLNTISANAVRAAWGQRTQATNFKNEAIAKRAGAASISPALAGTTSLLGSASSIASSWYMLNKSGGNTAPGASNVQPFSWKG